MHACRSGSYGKAVIGTRAATFHCRCCSVFPMCPESDSSRSSPVRPRDCRCRSSKPTVRPLSGPPPTCANSISLSPSIRWRLILRARSLGRSGRCCMHSAIGAGDAMVLRVFGIRPCGCFASGVRGIGCPWSKRFAQHLPDWSLINPAPEQLLLLHLLLHVLLHLLLHVLLHLLLPCSSRSISIPPEQRIVL